MKEIEDMIYEIRGKQVIFDSDLAKLYEVETKRINEAVKNNPYKFPIRFSWTLTKEETKLYSRSKISTLNESTIKRGQNVKYLPRVFTEQGVAMLATILKSKVAINVSMQIMDAFVAMRRYISTNLIEQKYINEIVLEDNKRINTLEKTFSKFEEKRRVNEIYFEGQIFDAYSKIIDIFKESKKELIIIDAYADKTILELIKNINIKVTLVVRSKSLLTKTDIEKYYKQYTNLKVIYNNTFHDRYFILDKKTIYHCGTSLNRMGTKTFSINLLEDEIVKELLILKLEKMIQI